MLATRLEAVLPDIFSKEQTGYIKGHHSFFSIRTLLNIIYSTPTTERPEVLIALDAKKAFDQVEWLYLFTPLKRFGFGDRFFYIQIPRQVFALGTLGLIISHCHAGPGMAGP